MNAKNFSAGPAMGSETEKGYRLRVAVPAQVIAHDEIFSERENSVDGHTGVALHKFHHFRRLERRVGKAIQSMRHRRFSF